MISSIYIHIPFCRNICSYCDFSKFLYNKKIVDSYIDSLIKEIKHEYRNNIIDTIYIGGGTPSCLDKDNLTKLLSFLKDNIKISNDLEYTFECNIEDINKELLILLKEYNVNRISIGIESFNDDILKYLNRSYKSNIIFTKINLVKEYFTNINIDLIYAVNNDINNLKNDLENIIKLDVKHISCYSLIISKHTLLYNKKIKYIEDDIDRYMYELIESTLEISGYMHYEVSNYAKDGYKSKHNSCYWENHKYYGFGLSASGYIDNYRYTNTLNLNKYLNGDYQKSIDKINIKSLASNYAILGLRTLKGVNLDEFRENVKIPFKDYFDVSDLIRDNILIEKDNYIYLNKDYWYVENDILTRFI